MPRNTDLTRNGETRLLNEWLAKEHAGDVVYLRVRMGAAVPLQDSAGLSEAERAMVGVWRRWADAVVVTEGERIIVEAKVKASPAAVGQLHLYADLAPFTAELLAYGEKPLVLQLVVGLEDPAVTRLCERFGIRQVVYRPDWLPIYLVNFQRRETSPPRDFAGGASLGGRS
jgi:hypothetical protein